MRETDGMCMHMHIAEMGTQCNFMSGSVACMYAENH